MEKIYLTEDGIILKKGKPVTDNVLPLLSNTIELDPGFTLASFFAIIDRYKSFKKMSELLETFLTMAKAGKGQFPKTQRTKALKFFQMESLLEHELILGDLKHIVFGDGQDMFTYETFYTLFEFIEGITWEMSFNFNPLQCSIRG